MSLELVGVSILMVIIAVADFTSTMSAERASAMWAIKTMPPRAGEQV